MKKTLLILIAMSLLIAGTYAIGETEDVSHGGDIIYTQPLSAVLFSHKAHVENLGLGCEMCHAGLFEMAARAAEKSPDFTMKGLAEGKFCGSCHKTGSMAFDANSQCARCHIGVKGANPGKAAAVKKH